MSTPYFGQCLICSKGIQASDDVSAVAKCGHLYHTACIDTFPKNAAKRLAEVPCHVFVSFMGANRLHCCLYNSEWEPFKLHLNYDSSILESPARSAMKSKVSKEGQEKIKALEKKLADLRKQVALERARAAIEKAADEDELARIRKEKERSQAQFLKTFLPRERHCEIPSLVAQNGDDVTEVAKLVTKCDNAMKNATALKQRIEEPMLECDAACADIL